jgi:peptidoglycan/LPS O-acetylase OafA/YrhL
VWRSNINSDCQLAQYPPFVNWELLATLRFLLALIVVCHHITMHFRDVDGFTKFVAEFAGKAAVIGFLLVSGFSIAASFERNRRDFYRRRSIRVYPLYIVAVVVGFALEQSLHGFIEMPSGAQIYGNGLLVAVGNALLVQTFLVKPIAFNGPVWSLAIEVS